MTPSDPDVAEYVAAAKALVAIGEYFAADELLARKGIDLCRMCVNEPAVRALDNTPAHKLKGLRVCQACYKNVNTTWIAISGNQRIALTDWVDDSLCGTVIVRLA